MVSPPDQVGFIIAVMRILLCAAMLGSLCAAAELVITAESLLEAKLLDRVREIEGKIDGVLGVAAIDLTNGRVVAHHADIAFPREFAQREPSQRAG